MASIASAAVPAAFAPSPRSAGPRVEVKPPLLSVVMVPLNSREPESIHFVVLDEMPPITESSTLDHPCTD